MWRKKKLFTTILAGALLLAPASQASATVDQKNLDTLTTIFSLLVDDHVTHPDQEKLLRAAINGMLSELNDPFTNYFTPEEYQSFVNAIQQSYAGIGIVMNQSPDGQALIVQEVYPGTPAEQAGLRSGDRIVQVDSTVAKPTNLTQLADMMRGKADTNVTLQVVRGASAPRSYTLTRKAIQLPMVLAKDLGDGVGYLRIYSFGDRTTEEYAKALTDLKGKGAKKLVLDLRGNGGGLVKSAVEIADSLLTTGTILTMHSQGQTFSLTADEDGDGQIPVAVLVDQNSASASEILAGALQKNGRAKLIGETTYGKGTMQEPLELPNGGYLKVTVDRWTLADGTSPDHVGLTPDVGLTLPESFLNGALQALNPQRQETMVFHVGTQTGRINDVELHNTVQPIQEEGKLYLPLRYTFEMLGSPVTWQAAEQQVQFAIQGHQVAVELTTSHVLVDGKLQTLTQPVRSINGVSYLSADALPLLGIDVQVDANQITLHTR